MLCPFCHTKDTRVIDSRDVSDGEEIRRRRECPNCGERFNTLESAQLKLPAVVKTDASREPFDEAKLRHGIGMATRKLAVGTEQIEAAVGHILKSLRVKGVREVESIAIGELVMEELKHLDPVAYVRFASVYRRFEDVQAFSETVQHLQQDATPRKP